MMKMMTQTLLLLLLLGWRVTILCYSLETAIVVVVAVSSRFLR
jgi:hypothetical protein